MLKDISNNTLTVNKINMQFILNIVKSSINNY